MQSGGDMADAQDFTVEDIEYLRHGEKPLLARFYRPRRAGPHPGVVEVHGGAWGSNDRLTNVDIHEALAKAGVVVMAIDFRMPPEAQYPASVCDINYAVRWFKHHARDYDVDPARIGGVGTSSGGHQIMLSTLRPNDTRYATIPLTGPLTGSQDASLAYIALCWPINDPLARYRMALAKGNTRLAAAHDAFWPDEAAMEDANPQIILDRGESKNLPPALLLQGTTDDNVTPDMADRFAAAYQTAGGTLELVKFPGQPHAFIARDPQAAETVRALDLIATFVRRQGT
jgi:acetyl esterase